MKGGIWKVAMTEYNPKDDIKLWQQYVAGDSEAEERLIARFSLLVRICSRSYFLIGGETEDLVQEGMLGLLSALRTYKPDRAVPLSSYAEYCIRRRMLDAVKASNRKKNLPLNSSVSLEFPVFENGLSSSAGSPKNPEDLIIERERAEEILRNLKSVLSRYEAGILELYLEGLSCSEIAAHFCKPAKSVDNAIQRIRKKLQRQLNLSESSES